MNPLGERIKAARLAVPGLSQAQLALRCGWESAARIGNYEQGTREPTLADLQKIAAGVKDGGKTYEWIVLGYDPSQAARLNGEKIIEAIQMVMASRVGLTAESVVDAYDLLIIRAGSPTNISDMPPPKPKGPPAHGIVKGGNTGAVTHSGRARGIEKK